MRKVVIGNKLRKKVLTCKESSQRHPRSPLDALHSCIRSDANVDAAPCVTSACDQKSSWHQGQQQQREDASTNQRGSKGEQKRANTCALLCYTMIWNLSSMS